uniref:C2 domain-containing protein n=1 Tax=Leersia perrieri TaxID=77586 RepID=A0A0D9V119_9ORYZ
MNPLLNSRHGVILQLEEETHVAAAGYDAQLSLPSSSSNSSTSISSSSYRVPVAMAGYRVLELTLVSASDLKKVTLFSRMRVYAVASISGSNVPMPMHGTHADRKGGRNPAWNTVLHFPVPADTRGLALHVQLCAHRAFGGSRDVGDVFVPLDDLLAAASSHAHHDAEPKPASYQVRRPVSGRAHGTLYFCYRFTDVKPPSVYLSAESEKTTEKNVSSASPVTAYPPPPSSGAAVAYPPVVPYGAPYGGYPPPPQQYGGYAAPPPPYGYSAAPEQPATYGYAAAPARKGGSGMGMGLGLGLLGGAVGGMMVGEMVGDMEADAAYDAGFNDALEF